MEQIEKVLKLSAGIDISKDSFDVCLVRLTADLQKKVLGHKKFNNNNSGFKELDIWLSRLNIYNVSIAYIMEVTGVYYEGLAYYLYENNQLVHVILPNKSKKYGQSLEIKSKTDKLDSQILAFMCSERNLRKWNPGSNLFKALRCLTRERENMVHQNTMLKNQLHAIKHTEAARKKILKRYIQSIEYIENQIKAIETDINELIQKNAEVKSKVSKVLTIPGVGITTVAVIIAETNGFAAIENIKQLSSYAGYDVKIRESGKWRGTARISKQGNSHIRAALYFPAWTAVKYNEAYKENYQRIKEKTTKPMKANTAIQRKLLGLIYTLWKNNCVFEDKYSKHVA